MNATSCRARRSVCCCSTRERHSRPLLGLTPPWLRLDDDGSSRYVPKRCPTARIIPSIPLRVGHSRQMFGELHLPWDETFRPFPEDLPRSKECFPLEDDTAETERRYLLFETQG